MYMYMYMCMLYVLCYVVSEVVCRGVSCALRSRPASRMPSQPSLDRPACIRRAQPFRQRP